MRAGLAGIDHAVVLVRALDAAQAAWRRLGFTLTPRGHHTLGSSNHCIMFGRGYVELLAVPPHVNAMVPMRDFLARREGLGGLAFSCTDAAALHRSCAADALAAAAPVDFSRPVARAGVPGGRGDARFRIVHLPPAATPGLATFACQHFTPELVWLPEDLQHANGATALAGVLMACDEPEAVAQRYAGLTGAAAAAHGDGWRVDLGPIRIELARAAAWAARWPGLTLPQGEPALAVALVVQVADTARTLQALRAGAIDAVSGPEGALGVGHEHASGTALIFEPAR